MENEKLIQLGAYCSGIAHGVLTGDARKMALDMCAALARALFPPMAKPLVWSNEKTMFIGMAGGIETHRVYLSLKTYFARDIHGTLIKECGTATEAKAACESHHQARFLEQLA